MQAEPKGKFSDSPPSGRRLQLRIPLRLLSFLIAALLLAISSLIAFTQTPHPNPLDPPETLSLDWWRFPLERNAWKRLPAIDADLNDIFVLPGTEKIWAVGTGGIILHSNDAGQNWQRQNQATTQPPPAKAATLGLISSAFAAEAPPVSKEQYLQQQKQQIVAPADLQILNQGYQYQPTTPQQAEEPLQPVDPATTTLLAVHFIDQQQGWAVGHSGLILRTIDGGRTWQQQDSGTRSRLIGIQFIGGNGWATGADGTLLYSSDRGESWELLSTLPGNGIYATQFVAGDSGWAIDQNGFIQNSSDGGQRWSRVSAPPVGLEPQAIFFIDLQTGWVVGQLGRAVRTTDGGRSWEKLDTGSEQTLKTVQFVDSEHGWAAGGRGAVLQSSDGGLSWQEHKLPTDHQLNSLYFIDTEQGWVAGNRGALFRTNNGGLSWQPLSRPVDTAVDSAAYARYPAPWYYLSWLLAALLLLPATRQPEQVIFERKSVADMLVSDKPLEAGEPDPLNFGLVARALSRYLRNENTQPPLTIAITGEWGTGKSSLMNLLKADLKQYGVRPVWFNAWHHQKESNLLASLLDNIRNQAVPSWWRFSGVNFRLRLLLVRGWRNCLPVLFVLFVFALSLGVVCHYPGDLRSIEWRQLLDSSFSLSGTADALLEKFPFLTLWASTLTLLVAVFRGFVAFGLDPKKLIPTIPGRLRIKNLNIELSFRQKFSREFKDVTSALQPRTMLILIDDLDRCQAEHVLEILETINYLVSSGECYVVLGMARERVERCIGAAFKEVAEDMIDDPIDVLPTDNGRKKRVEFARQYLEKLINIEVPVPVATADQSQLLLAPKPATTEPPSRWDRRLSLLVSIGKKLLPWGLLLLVLWGGYWLGKQSIEEPGQVKLEARQEAVTATGGAGSGSAARLDNVVPLEEDSIQPASYTPGQTASFPKTLLLYPLLVLAAAGFLLLVRRPEYKVQDSPEFGQALEVWHPLIVAKRNTPRSIKRFLNRVRYFAMINRDQHGLKVELKSGRPFLRLRNSADLTLEQTPNITEATLVALGALHHVHPQLIKNQQLFQQLNSRTVISPSSLTELGIPQQLSGTLRDVLKAHENVFGSWSCSENERALFLEISQGIQII